MKARNLAQSSVLVAAVIGSLVLLNLMAVRFFGRADLTKDHIYTLSQASRDTVANLDDQVTVTAYFTGKLPPPYSSNARYVHDLLEEYRAVSKGKLSFQMIDPAADETQKDKATKRETKTDIFGRTYREPTEMEKELAAAGVQPVEIRVVAEDQQQTQRAYMGLVIRYGEKKETIPVVQNVSGLEYDITSLIRKLTRTKTPVLGVFAAQDPQGQDHFRALKQLLSQTYDVRPATLQANKRFDPALDALYVLGPRTAVDVPTQKAIDQFLMQGKSVAFLLDTVSVDLRQFQPTPVEHGLAPLLAGYGVTVGDQLVADVSSANLNVSEQRGFMTVTMPVPYPFIPLVQRLEGDSPVTRGLSMVSFPFATSVSATSADGRTATVLAQSSKKSWLEGKPPNLDPRRDWRQETVTPSGPWPLAVAVTGKLKSHFASEANTSPPAGEPPVLAESKGDARLLVVGTSAPFQDDFLSNRANAALAMNVADWMLLDPAMLSMRSRGLAMAPIQDGLPDVTRAAVKFGNALGLPVLLALFGLLWWRMREARRLRVAP